MNYFSSSAYTHRSLGARGRRLVFGWYAGLVMMATLALLSLSTGCGDVGPKPNDFCTQMTDCAPGQDCLNAVCVPRRADGVLPWDEVPTHGDAGKPDTPPVCSDGSSRACPNAKGPCAKGEQLCVGGVWGECSVQPADQETCNGRDDDCDGVVDNGVQGVGEECQVRGEKGECAKGIFACEQGIPSCQKVYEATEEGCNGKDDDCDGKIDNIKSSYCIVPGQKGICQAGVTACQDGKQVCEQVNQPADKESCDGKDHNCNGQPYDGCSCRPGQEGSCYSGAAGCKEGGTGQWECTGPCKFGTRRCGSNGQWGPCVGEITPTMELCDGKDNDCDGRTDEDFPRKGKVCSAGVGRCEKRGQFVCNQAKNAVICNAQAEAPQKEECNGKDDDCDGDVDEGLKRPCQNTSGLCASGSQVCKGGAWQVCDVRAVPEICSNQLDDDCDGQVDEKSAEACDGYDNDCDGKVDEDCGAYHAAASVSAAGVLSAKRDFVSAAPDANQKPEYLLTANPGVQCGNSVLLLTPLSSNASVATYKCDGSSKSAFRVYTFEQQSTNRQLTPQQLGFHAVVPKTGAYGIVKCSASANTNGSYCTLHSRSSSTMTIKYANDPANGLVKIYHDACKDTRQPLFATLIGSTPGYVRAKSVGFGYCEFQTFRGNGKPGFRDFAFWIPPIEEAAWAEVDGNGKIVSQTANLNSSVSARITNTRTLAGGVGFLRDNVSYAALPTPSLLLLTPRAAGFGSNDPAFAMSTELANASKGVQFSVFGFRHTGTVVGHAPAAPDKGYFLRIIRLK